MSWNTVQVNFNIVDNRGWSGGASTSEIFDTSVGLKSQAELAVDRWMERQNRIFGTTIKACVLLSVFWADGKGYWHAADFGRPESLILWR